MATIRAFLFMRKLNELSAVATVATLPISITANDAIVAPAARGPTAAIPVGASGV